MITDISAASLKRVDDDTGDDVVSRLYYFGMKGHLYRVDGPLPASVNDNTMVMHHSIYCACSYLTYNNQYKPSEIVPDILADLIRLYRKEPYAGLSLQEFLMNCDPQ